MLTASWHYGLYRRIGLSFIALVTFVVVAGALGYVVLFQRLNVNSEDATQRGLAWTRAISADLSGSLTQDASLDISKRLAQLDVTGRVFVIFKDGRVVGPAPPNVISLVLTDFKMLRDEDPPPPSWESSMYCAAFLKANGKLLAVVGLKPRTVLDRYWPLLVPAGIALLLVAILGFSVAVVQPVRTRLRDLQQAARQLGAGQLEARARADGADEVADVAKAFNAMADELQNRTLALETSDRLRRQLVADVSHELMTPLTAVLGHLETLDMDEVDLDRSERRKQVAIARREAKRLRRVIGDLLTTAKYEAGGIELGVEEISTVELFRQVTLRHEFECRTRHIAFSATVSPDAAFFDADPFRIEQAIENVVANALRHTPDDGRISLDAYCKGGDIVIEVTDSGEGIPAEHLPHIFDRFYKASSAEGLASPGSGLGLSIVKAIVGRHHGHVNASSASGVGTIIRMQFPARHAAVEHHIEA